MRRVLRLGLWLAIGVFSSVGCKRVQPVPEPDEQLTRPRTAALPLEPGAPVATPMQATATAAAASSGGVPTQDAAPKVEAKLELRPELRRLVVSAAIKDKEPVPLTALKINEPVVAFLELANPNAASSVVRVVFQHESGHEVGFVELAVPAEKTRWRTWAQTGMIKQAGKWTAIVRAADGSELGQQGFFVGPTSG